jgi:hypothetical protein
VSKSKFTLHSLAKKSNSAGSSPAIIDRRGGASKKEMHMRYSCWRLIAAAAAMSIALTGCGKSADAKREDIVKCSGFSLSIMMNMKSGSSLEKAAEAALAKDGITVSDTMAVGNAAQQYAAKMDPAKVTRLTQEGSSSAIELLRANDASGVASYMKGCVSAYKDLGS